MDTLHDFPIPADRYPFKAGEAVYYLHGHLSCLSTKPPTLIPAMILEAQPAPVTGHTNAPRIAIWREDGRRTRVKGFNLIYRGYCSFCSVPAVISSEHGRLICPTCGEDATAVPPPDDLVLRWYPLGHDVQAQAVRACVLTKCGWRDGLNAWRDPHQKALGTMLERHRMTYGWLSGAAPWNDHRFIDLMRWHAERGDDASFLACYQDHGGKDYARVIDMMLDIFDECLEEIEGDGPGRVSQRLQLPPLDIVRSAEDSQPDGADDLTAWLEQQFKRAA